MKSSLNYSHLADVLKPYLAGWVRQVATGGSVASIGGGGGGGGMASHVLASTGGLGTYHSVSGLTAGQVLKASGADDARFAVLNHGELGGVGPNDHHNRAHALDSASDHTGSLPWAWLSKTGSDLAHLATRKYTDLTDRQHSITGGDHSLTGSQYQLVGATGANTLGLLTPSADVSSGTTAILRSNAGTLGLRTLTSGTALSITAAGDIDIDAGGADVIFDYNDALRSGNYLAGFPLAGFRIGPTSLAGQTGVEAGLGQFDELRARIFVADETRVDRGQEYSSKSYGILSRSFVAPAAPGGTVNVYFEDSPHIAGALFSNNDWVLFQFLSFASGVTLYNTWGQVTGYDTTGLTGEQRWTFTMRAGTGGMTYRAGAIAVGFGASGQGYILRDSISATAPYIQIGRWVTNPYTPANRTVLTQVGRLDGVGFTGEYGIAASVEGFAVDKAWIKVSTTDAAMHNVPVRLYNGSTLTGQWLADGRLSISATGMGTLAERDVILDPVNNYVRLGQEGAGKPNIKWDATTGRLDLRMNTTPVITFDSAGDSYFSGVMTIGASGEIRQGTGTLGSNYTGLRIWRDTNVGRIGGYNNNVLQWYAGTDGRLLAGGGKTVLDAGGLWLLGAKAAYDAKASLTFSNVVGGTMVGELRCFDLGGADVVNLRQGTGGPFVTLSTSGTTTQIDLDAGSGTTTAITAAAQIVSLSGNLRVGGVATGGGGGALSVGAALNVSGAVTVTENIGASRGTATSGTTRTISILGARNTSGTDFAQLLFMNYDNNSGSADYIGAKIASQNDGAVDDGDLRFSTADNQVLTERMRIESTGGIAIPELSGTPTNPASGAECKFYMKADKFVIQYNDGGTVRYKYLDLTGTGVTWVHTTSAP